MCIDRNCRLTVCDVQNYVRSLAAYAWQPLQVLAPVGDQAVVLGNEFPRQRYDIFGFVSEETDRFNPLADLFFRESSHFLRSIGSSEESWRCLIHRCVGRLRGEDYGNKKRKGIAIFQLGLWFGVERLKPREHLCDLGAR